MMHTNWNLREVNMSDNKFIPDYMKTKDFIVVVLLIILVNVILFFFDKEQNGPKDMILSSIKSNAIVIVVVLSIFILWKRKVVNVLWKKITKK